MWETARLETERLAQEAYEEGFRKGRADGEDEFRKEVGASAEALAAVSESIRAAHSAFLESLEPQVLSLVQAIVQRVLYRDMRADPDLVLRTVRHALENLTDRARLLVRLNPADLEVVRNHKLTFLEEFDGVRQMELMGDDTITSGGCIVESELMQVDAQLDERLERVFEAMLE
jgi:flagellar assembly protein FliH